MVNVALTRGLPRLAWATVVLGTVVSGRSFLIYGCILTAPLLGETVSGKLLGRVKGFPGRSFDAS
jgi:hypothetical protein